MSVWMREHSSLWNAICSHGLLQKGFGMIHFPAQNKTFIYFFFLKGAMWAQTNQKNKLFVLTDLALESKYTILFIYFYLLVLTHSEWDTPGFTGWACLNNGFEVWTLLCVSFPSMVGHWRESPLKMEHAWSQGWATECNKCLSLRLGETWPPGQRLSSQRRLCAYQHHSSQRPRHLLTMQRRLFSPHAGSPQDRWRSWQKLFWVLHSSTKRDVPHQVRKGGGKTQKYKCKFWFSAFPPIFRKWARFRRQLNFLSLLDCRRA